MKTTVQLDSKDLREIVALFFRISEEDVIPNRYSFGIAHMTAEEIQARIAEAKKEG